MSWGSDAVHASQLTSGRKRAFPRNREICLSPRSQLLIQQYIWVNSNIGSDCMTTSIVRFVSNVLDLFPLCDHMFLCLKDDVPLLERCVLNFKHNILNCCSVPESIMHRWRIACVFVRYFLTSLLAGYFFDINE